MNERENWLRAVRLQHPEWIPCSMSIGPLTWHAYRSDLEQVVLAHPRLFPRYRAGGADFYDAMPPVYRQGEYFLDHWGCTWYNIQSGLEGQVVGHPLEDWSALDSYVMPDPKQWSERGSRDWDAIARDVALKKMEGLLVWGDGERLFDRLYFLRGFENLMFDFADEPPQLQRLVAMLEAYEIELIRLWLSLGVDVMGFHTDIGTQHGLMIHPAAFRKYIKPMFARLFQACREGGALVYLSSDGRLIDIVDDLIDCGVAVHDPQIRANTLADIARAYRGRLCANVDLDRQGFPFMTPAAIREHVKQVVDVMAVPEGGLMVAATAWGDDIPLRNIAAMCEALEDFCFQHA